IENGPIRDHRNSGNTSLQSLKRKSTLLRRLEVTGSSTLLILLAFHRQEGTPAKDAGQIVVRRSYSRATFRFLPRHPINGKWNVTRLLRGSNRYRMGGLH